MRGSGTRLFGFARRRLGPGGNAARQDTGYHENGNRFRFATKQRAMAQPLERTYNLIRQQKYSSYKSILKVCSRLEKVEAESNRSTTLAPRKWVYLFDDPGDGEEACATWNSI